MFLWCDGPHDPAENMRRDAALLAAAEHTRGVTPGTGEIPEPVLRLFRFDPPAITIGRSQDPARELDLARCARDAIGWARRPTGGRAIFHAEEWTYSFATPLDHPEWKVSPAQIYERISQVIAASLIRLGVAVSLSRGASRGRTSGARAADGPAAPCFASTARHELTLGGRKLVGSAQRRTSRALLQQGSVLLGVGYLRLADYLALEANRRESVRASLAVASSHAGAVLGRAAPLERWADALTSVITPPPERVEGAQGLFLLTPREAPSYTPRAC